MIKKINIDIVRFIVALFIVAIHVYPFISFNETFDYMITRVLFRIGVPFFFMLTGYYVLPKVLKNKQILKEYTIKILKLYGISILIYLPINIYNGYFSHFEFLTFIKDLAINGTFYHLWYFPASIVGLWITYYLIKKLTFYKILCFVILLYLIGLFGDSYYGIIQNITILKNIYDCLFCFFDYTRNGLFFTPVFLYIGYYLSTQNSKIEESKNICFLLLSLIAMMIEGFLLYQFHTPRHNSMYLFLLPFSYFFFEFLIFHNHASNKKIRQMATWIYILHPLFIVGIRLISKFLNISIFVDNSFIHYIMVLFFTIGFIFVIEKVKEVIKYER